MKNWIENNKILFLTISCLLMVVIIVAVYFNMEEIKAFIDKVIEFIFVPPVKPTPPVPVKTTEVPATITQEYITDIPDTPTWTLEPTEDEPPTLEPPVIISKTPSPATATRTPVPPTATATIRKPTQKK